MISHILREGKKEYDAPIKEEEQPNKYSILNSDTGKWQIIKRDNTGHFWQVVVKDLGSRGNAVLMLDALLNKEKA